MPDGKMKVALLAEGVDRNIAAQKSFGSQLMSPSSRRAWIEIMRTSAGATEKAVALLAEGVDRNRP